jgi:branched-chain amino acid transport system substrate-binding protein
VRLPSNLAAVSSLIGLFLLACPKRVRSQAELGVESREKLEAAKKEAAAGRSDEAIRLLKEIPEDDLQVADALFAVGESQHSAREYEKARATYRELLSRFPLFDQTDLAKYHLALCQLELKEFRDALESLSPALPGLPEEEKPAAMEALARAAEGARAFGEAVRWRAELVAQARDARTREGELVRVAELLESKVGFLDVAKLAQDIPAESPLWPMVQFKLARIFGHLRDRERYQEALTTLLEKAPESAFAGQARELLERSQRATQARPDTLGVLLPLSGKYKSYGESVLAGLQLGLADSAVKVVVRDTAGDAAKARAMAAQLAQDEQVIAMVGPVLTGESEDAASEAELQETPIVTVTRAENITDRGPFVFRNMLTNSAQAKALADWAIQVKGYKTFGLLYPSIPYGTDLMNYFWDAVESSDGEVRAVESYEADQTTFSPTVKKLVGRYHLEHREDYTQRRKEIVETVKDPFRRRKLLEDARKKLEPIVDFEALFIPDYYMNIGLVAPALAVEDIITNACDKRDVERIAKTQGKPVDKLKTVQLLGGNGWNFDDLVKRGEKFVRCAVFVDGFFAGSDRKETREFVEAFRRAAGREPSLLEAEGYDTARILRMIVEKERPSTRAAFREALTRVKDFPGATGSTTFNAKREAEKPLFFLTIDKDAIRELDSEVKS